LPPTYSLQFLAGRPQEGCQSNQFPGIPSLVNLHQKITGASSVHPNSVIRPDLNAEIIHAALLSNQFFHPSAFQSNTAFVPLSIDTLACGEQKKSNDEKLLSKRISNRKSARVSRARKKAVVEEMAKTNEEMKLHQRVLDLLPDAIFAVDRSGYITYSSAACSSFLKVSATDLSEQKIYRFVSPDNRETLKSHIQELFASGQKNTNQASKDKSHHTWLRPHEPVDVTVIRGDGSSSFCSVSSNLRCITDEDSKEKELFEEVVLVFRPYNDQKYSTKMHNCKKTKLEESKHPVEHSSSPEISAARSHPQNPNTFLVGSNRDEVDFSLQYIAKNSEDVQSAVKSLFMLRTNMC